jgi:PAS domain S-box-containing protein
MTSSDSTGHEHPPLAQVASSRVSARVDIENVREILPALIDALSDAVLVVDSQRRVVAANRRYSEAFGLKRMDVVGSACNEALHCPEAREGEAVRCVACVTMAEGVPQRCLRNLPDAKGVMRRWEATFTPLHGSNREVTHVVEVWRDISDRRQLEVQLSHSERLASVGLLASGVAHEINNPLASLLAGAEVLGRWLARGSYRPEDVAEATETVGMMLREIERCRETTGKLMLLGRSYEAAPGWVDLNRAIADTLALLRFEVRKREIEVVEELDPALSQIWARQAAMRGVCMNLMINAVQAMAGGGRLTVSSRRLGEDEVVLAIQDTGPGIAAEHLDRIWDPFFTTKPVGQGTGLGLSITNRLVSRHGGRVAVESVLGQGARFIVTLPIHGPGGET